MENETSVPPADRPPVSPAVPPPVTPPPASDFTASTPFPPPPSYTPPPPPLPPRKAPMNFWGCMSVFGILCFAFLALCMIGLFFSMKSCCETITEAAAKSTGEKDGSSGFLCGDEDSSDVIAVIDVKGVIVSGTSASYRDANAGKICEQIRNAAKDPSVRAILVRLDTPGGEVTASDVIYHELKTCGKPVVAQMNSMACSGGYYVASGADKIVANRLTLTGSIGVIIQTLNYSELFDKVGLEAQLFTSGKMKAMLSGSQETTEAEKRVAQELVMNTYSEFVKIVSEARKIPADKIVGTQIGDGRILDGAQAFKLGLVDRLGYFEDAVQEAETLANLSPGSAKVIIFSSKNKFLEMIMDLTAGQFDRSVRVELPGASSNGSFRMQPGKAYYLPFAQ